MNLNYTVVCSRLDMAVLHSHFGRIGLRDFLALANKALKTTIGSSSKDATQSTSQIRLRAAAAAQLQHLQARQGQLTSPG